MASEKTATFDDAITPIASITKMFTAATLLRMTEHDTYKHHFGKGVDTPISDLMPALRTRYPANKDFLEYLEGKPQYEEVTLKHLLQHTHGFGSITPACLPDILSAPDKKWGAEDGLQKKYLENDQHQSVFGQYNYSNAGYYLLGAIIEATSGNSYTKMVQELVIAPLGLNNTYTNDAPIPAGKPIIYGFRDNNGRIEEDKVEFPTYAAGMLRSTPPDICKFTEAFFAGTDGSGSNVLFSKAMVTRLNTDLVPQGNEKGEKSGLGFKTFLNTGTNRELRGHDGSSWGVRSLALHDPETGKSTCTIKLNTRNALDKFSTENYKPGTSSPAVTHAAATEPAAHIAVSVLVQSATTAGITSSLPSASAGHPKR